MPETVARLRYHRTSAPKVRQVMRLIVGKDVLEAREILRFCERGPAETVMKVLDSAIANAEHNDNMPEDELYVARAFADEGPTMKRGRPRARGRYGRIKKRSSHLTIVVARFDDDELERRREREAAAGAPARVSRRRRVAASRRRAEAHDHDHDHDHDHEGHDHDHDHDHDEDHEHELLDELEAETEAADEVDVDAADETELASDPEGAAGERAEADGVSPAAESERSSGGTPTPSERDQEQD
jgi:large subunit ribosomal protein L22